MGTGGGIGHVAGVGIGATRVNASARTQGFVHSIPMARIRSLVQQAIWEGEATEGDLVSCATCGYHYEPDYARCPYCDSGPVQQDPADSEQACSDFGESNDDECPELTGSGAGKEMLTQPTTEEMMLDALLDSADFLDDDEAGLLVRALMATHGCGALVGGLPKDVPAELASMFSHQQFSVIKRIWLHAEKAVLDLGLPHQTPTLNVTRQPVNNWIRYSLSEKGTIDYQVKCPFANVQPLGSGKKLSYDGRDVTLEDIIATFQILKLNLSEAARQIINCRLGVLQARSQADLGRALAELSSSDCPIPTQKEFAVAVGVSEPTISHWHTRGVAITTPSGYTVLLKQLFPESKAKFDYIAQVFEDLNSSEAEAGTVTMDRLVKEVLSKRPGYCTKAYIRNVFHLLTNHVHPVQHTSSSASGTYKSLEFELLLTSVDGECVCSVVAPSDVQADAHYNRLLQVAEFIADMVQSQMNGKTDTSVPTTVGDLCRLVGAPIDQRKVTEAIGCDRSSLSRSLKAYDVTVVAGSVRIEMGKLLRTRANRHI